MAIPLAYNLRNLRVRKAATLMTAGGIALVVAVLVLTLALASGFQQTLVATGRADNLHALRTGATNEIESGIAREVARVMLADEAVARRADGQPVASAECVVLTTLARRGSQTTSNVSVRGVGPGARALRPELRLIAGRYFNAGQDEVVVGRGAAARFAGAGLGESLRFGARDWRVVGVFEAAGSAFESEIWGDAELLMPAFDRDGYSSLTLRLADPSAYDAVKSRLEADPRLRVDLRRESEFYAAQSQQLAGLLRGLGFFLVVVMAFGAVFGALNTMYAAVGARAKEIGTLLAIGYRPWQVMASFLFESLLISLVGGLLGCLLALPIHGVSTGTTNWSSFSEVAFRFRITPGILLAGLTAALLLGLIGGWFPARSAARRVIAEALRG